MIGSWFVIVASGEMREDIRVFLYDAEYKTVKNRLHIDLNPDAQAAEAERRIDMGARPQPEPAATTPGETAR